MNPEISRREFVTWSISGAVTAYFSSVMPISAKAASYATLDKAWVNRDIGESHGASEKAASGEPAGGPTERRERFQESHFLGVTRSERDDERMHRATADPGWEQVQTTASKIATYAAVSEVRFNRLVGEGISGDKMRALTSELSRTERRIASYTSSIELSVDVARAITNRSSDKDVAAALGHIVEGGFTYVTEPLIILGAKWLVKSAFVAIFAPEATAFVVAQLGFAGGEKLYEKVFKKSVNEFIADSVVPFARHPIERTELMLSDVQRRIENLLLENVDLSRPTP